MVQKTITSHNLQLVTFGTSLAISEVLSRLDKEVNKPADQFSSLLRGASSKDELKARVDNVVGPSGFLYFNEFNHGAWLQLFFSSPQAVVYVIGNPFIAETMLRHDVHGAYNIPPRVLVLEKADGTGTEVVYHLPSSVVALDDQGELRAAAEGLDRKLEALVERITTV